MFDPVKLFEAMREYDKSAENAESQGFNRCATIDPDYVGNGPARVTFDGETTLSQKSYHFINTPPRASTRVAMLPIGSTYVILGMVNGGV
jgi:hypothetical protein